MDHATEEERFATELRQALMAHLPLETLFDRAETLTPGMWPTASGWVQISDTVH